MAKTLIINEKPNKSNGNWIYQAGPINLPNLVSQTCNLSGYKRKDIYTTVNSIYLNGYSNYYISFEIKNLSLEIGDNAFISIFGSSPYSNHIPEWHDFQIDANIGDPQGSTDVNELNSCKIWTNKHGRKLNSKSFIVNKDFLNIFSNQIIKLRIMTEYVNNNSFFDCGKITIWGVNANDPILPSISGNPSSGTTGPRIPPSA